MSWGCGLSTAVQRWLHCTGLGCHTTMRGLVGQSGCLSIHHCHCCLNVPPAGGLNRVLLIRFFAGEHVAPVWRRCKFACLHGHAVLTRHWGAHWHTHRLPS